MTASRTLGELSPEQLAVFNERDDRLIVHGPGLRSPFFDIQPGVICDVDDQPLYDRPLIREAPSVVVVVWGRDSFGSIRLGLVIQRRPPADDPRSKDAHKPVAFAQMVMGYLDGDSIEKGALREKAEEIGKGKVLQVEIPAFPLMNLDPNTYATWHRLAFVEIDLETVDAAHLVAEELISGVLYMPLEEVLRYTARGWDAQGVSYREGHTLMALMIFFSIHPDYFPT